jgi:hypothetical protein
MKRDGRMTISTIIVTILFTVPPILSVNAAEKCQNTTLYPLTIPPGKPEHVILCHPTGKDLVKANNANISFDKGIVAAQHSSLTLTQCPNSDNKNLCSGWEFAKRYLK